MTPPHHPLLYHINNVPCVPLGRLPISACQVPPAGGGGGLLTKLRLTRNKEGGLVKEEERERASEMRSLGGFRLRGEGLQRRVGGRTDYCNVQREGEGKGIEGIHVSLLRGGDGGSQHHPYFAMSHGVLRSPMGQHYKKENRIFGSPLTAHPPNYLFSSLLQLCSDCIIIFYQRRTSSWRARASERWWCCQE